MSINRHRLLVLVVFACGLSVTGHTQAGIRLHSAAVNASLTSATSCDVTMALETTAGGDIDHRLEAFAGTQIELLAVRGAETGSHHDIGSTRSLIVRPGARQPYQIQYRITQPGERAFRCPLWVPALATDGRSRSVTIKVALPEGSTPSGSSFPALAWDGSGGTATLAHVPAFIRVAFAGGSTSPESAPLDIASTMDVLAVAMMAVATAGWLWRRRRA
jgi:hypothetical protein